MKIKNIIISFFALSAIIVKAQNVNPETFPQVSGSIQDKYLYTNTGGEGKVKIKSIFDSVPILDTISTTYADFYTLITGGNLQAGRTYILVDFRTVYDQMDFDNSGSLKPTLTTKQGKIEEIWVYALANDRIASTAYSKTYPNDQIQYDWTYNVTAVNGSPSYGRISERIDEWNNRTDYDHREIKFIRYDDGAGNFTVINDNGNASQEFLTFGNSYATNTGEVIAGNYLGDYYVFSSFIGQEYPNNVFHATTLMGLNKLGALCYNNTWGDNNYGNTWGDENNNNTWGDNNYGNTWGNENNNNTWGDENNNNTWGDNNYANTWGNDNNNNTWGDGNYSNTWGDDNNNNTWGNFNYSNTWGDGNYSNTFGDGNSSNTFGDGNYSNTFGNSNGSNTFGDGNYSNTFGNSNGSNTFGNSNGSNTFGDYNNSNTFGDDNNSNTFGDYNNSNTFGDDNNSNTFGNSNDSNTFGDDNNLNTFGNDNYSNTFGNSNSSNTFGNSNTLNTFGDYNNLNTWGDGNDSNTWGNDNDSNTWGDDNSSNTWGNSNQSNTFGDNNQSNTFTHTSFMRYLNINSNLQGKTIDDVTYPIIFNTDFKKEIILATDGNYYIKTFDGTQDHYTLIP